MATSLTPDAKNEDWAETRVTSGGTLPWSRAEWLWTLFGIALFCLFLAFVILDYPLRALISAQ
jgi:hypothetical protein